MKTKIFVCALLITITLAFTVGCSKKADNGFKSGNSDNLEGSILSWAVIPDEADEQATIEMAIRLYKYANQMDKESAYRKISTYGLIKAGPTCERYIFNVKNNGEWYYSEVQYSDNAFTNLVSKPFLTLKYGSLDLNKAVVLYSEKDISVDRESGVPTADLSKATQSEEALPVIDKSQEGEYLQTDFVIDVDTTKSAKIVDHPEEKYFSVTIELDVDNEKAVASPLSNLRQTVKDGKYVSCTEYIEIWYSGHYKYFNAVDNWTGTVVVKLNSVIDYKTYFTYDQEECNIPSFFGYDSLISLIKK